MYTVPPARTLFAATLSTLMLTLAPAAEAQDLSFGLTTDYERGDLGLVVEYHGAPVFGDARGFSGAWGVAARADSEANAWVGAGFALNANVTDRAFIEASFMPGYYHEGDTDLGYRLQFRSLIGVGWALSQDSAVILSIDHISNANLSDVNPGAETVALRYRLSF